MDGEHRRDGTRDERTANDGATSVRAHQTRPGRVVFTEIGNTDAWIASDLTVDPEA